MINKLFYEEHSTSNVPFTLLFSTKPTVQDSECDTNLMYNPTTQLCVEVANENGIHCSSGSQCWKLSGTTTTLLGGTDSDDDFQVDD